VRARLTTATAGVYLHAATRSLHRAPIGQDLIAYARRTVALRRDDAFLVFRATFPIVSLIPALYFPFIQREREKEKERERKVANGYRTSYLAAFAASTANWSMTTLFLTHAPTTSTHVPVLRLPYAGGPISRSHRRLRPVDAERVRWRALAVSARLADRQFERVARSVRPSVRPSDFAFNLLALRPQTSSKRRFVP